MRIDDGFSQSNDLRGLGQVDRTQDTQVEHKGRQQGSRTAEDSVSLSALGSQLAQAISTASPEEIAAVNAAQEVFQAGNFSAPASEVAESLISESLIDTQVEQQLGQQSGAPASPL